MLIKIALSCHVQEAEGIQWIVTRKNMIYHGCESCKPSRHGKTRKSIVSQWCELSKRINKHSKYPSIIIIINNNIHNIVIFEGLKKNPEKKGKKVVTCSQDLWVRMRTWQETGTATYVTSDHFNTRPRQYYSLSFTHLQEDIDSKFSMLF